MVSLLSPEGRRSIDALPERTLFGFDFDGTLAKLTRDPRKTAIEASTANFLRELSQRRAVAIVSGRSIAQLEARLPFRPRYLVGNHGLEGVASPRELARAKSLCRRWLDVIRQGLFAADPAPAIEDKTYSLAIPIARGRNRASQLHRLGAILATLQPAPRLLPGKNVLNLLPPHAPSKADALRALISRSRSLRAFYIGDDLTDESVFRLPRQVLAVRVGQSPSSSARFFIGRQSQIDSVLALLVAQSFSHV